MPIITILKIVAACNRMFISNIKFAALVDAGRKFELELTGSLAGSHAHIHKKNTIILRR
jgi:hypothetical protein